MLVLKREMYQKGERPPKKIPQKRNSQVLILNKYFDKTFSEYSTVAKILSKPFALSCSVNLAILQIKVHRQG
jgi:hypothetical protein